MTITGYFWLNIVLVPATIFTYGSGTHPFIAEEFFEIIFAGLIGSIGGILLNLAVTLGLAGPVFALANIQVIIPN